MQQAPLFILTGDRASGKTTFLMHLIQILKSNGLQPEGFYAIGYWQNNQRSKFELVNITTNKRILLCKTETETDWPYHQPYYFNPEAIRKGNDILKLSVKKNADIIIIDEVGKLEIRGFIWHHFLKKQAREMDKPMLWVIRKPFIKEALNTFGISHSTIIDIEHSTPEDVFGLIKSKLKL